MLYRHHAPSNTSLSDDDDDDDDLAQSNFFTGDQPPFIDAAIQPHWSSQADSPSNKKKAVAKSPISTVPPEILMYILKHLHQPRDLLCALRVSRTWCECAVELLWHKPAFPRYSTVETMARLLKRHKQTFSYPKFIRRLNFLSLGSELRDETFAIFSHCDRLERLTLNGCKLLTASALENSLTHFPNLVAVDLTNVKETTSEVIIAFAAVAKRLQGINLQSCKKVADPALVALAESCPLLRRVKLSGLELITDAGVSAIVKGCPLLLEIDLHQCGLITDVAIRDIWTYSFCMRELRLSMCKNLTDLAFPAPPRLETPVSSNPFPQRDEADFPPLIIDRTFEQLRMLDLTACANITDDAIEGIISHAPKIRNFVLSKCLLLTDRSVEAICHLGRNLHYLHLGHASKITDRSVKTLARACNRIRYVDFANCTNLTDMSVFELCALPKLRRIGLVRVNNLTDEAIYSLAERHATLERIHLSYCDQISVMAVHFLLLKLHKLTHLSLTGVPAFRQVELQRFCRDAPPDFNIAQRQSFCVFSGRGISQLRAYLTELFDQITEQNGTDDTEYEEEDDDTVAFQENDTPEPETADADDDFPLDPVHTPPPAHVTSRGSRLSTSRVPDAPRNPRAYQRDHTLRATSNPTHNHAEGSAAPRSVAAIRIQAETAVQGATSILNHQLLQQGGTTGWQRRGPATGTRTVADALPIVESPSSGPSAAQSGHIITSTLNVSDAALYYPAPPTVEPPIVRRDNGTRTPDLNFAEIGHGRGVQGSATAGPSTPGNRNLTETYQSVDVDMGHSHNPGRSTNTRSMSDPGTMAGLVFSQHQAEGTRLVQRDHGEPMDVDGPRERERRVYRRRDHGHTPGGEGGSRGRMPMRSRIRNGLNTAEVYASSLFGIRTPHQYAAREERGEGHQGPGFSSIP